MLSRTSDKCVITSVLKNFILTGNSLRNLRQIKIFKTLVCCLWLQMPRRLEIPVKQSFLYHFCYPNYLIL